MYNGNLVGLGTILWRVLKSPLAADLSYEQAAEYTLEFIKLIGAPLAYSDEVKKLEVTEYKARIPNNTVIIRGVRWLGKEGCDDPIAMRYATDLYHTSKQEKDCDGEYTYISQNCNLTTSKRTGFVEISIKTIATDEKGYPMIPDNESFKMGLEYYILYRHIEPLWSMGKVQDKVFSHYGQQRDWYLGQASNEFKLQGIDQLESAMNSLNRLIIQDKAHETFYKDFGQKEYIKRYH
jgi:hypothetical protein